MVSLNTSTPEDKSYLKISRASLRKSPQDSSTPPTSALVTKLFPQLKIKNNEEVKVDEPGKRKQSPKHSITQANDPLSTATTQSGKTTDSRDVAENVMSSAVREKLQELEKEIKKYREDNATLHSLREERENDLQELQREKSLFENQKTVELEKLEKFKAEEERRLRRDKRIFEQYQKALRALPDKKEREEITILKTKMIELQDDMKLRESRWSAAASRYKDRIANLEKENKEMKEEVKLLEKQNLELQHKDQQKTHELQQLKAFEKRKLSKPKEMPVKYASNNSASQPTTGKDAHFIKENEKRKTPPNTPPAVHQEPQKQAKVNSDKCLPRVEKKDVPVAEKHATEEHSSPKDTQRLQKTTTSDTCGETKESSNVTQAGLQELSPPSAKKANCLKSVRFKDDDSKQESQPELLPKKICHNDGKREVINPDGSRVVTFSNGTRKEISADGVSVIVTFFNGDVKQVMSDERVIYYYAEAQTTHTTYPDGMQVLQFPSNQIEKHYPDGTKEIIFPDQTVKYLYQSGAEECVFADGTVERINEDGSRAVEFPNGQRETYTKLFKKREFPDGTVKTVYTDGRQETRYPSGRLRMKDGEGRLLVDTADEKQTTP